jgi:hypothetical protein
VGPQMNEAGSGFCRHDGLLPQSKCTDKPTC